MNKIKKLKKQLDKDLAPLLGKGDSKEADASEGQEKEEKEEQEEKPAKEEKPSKESKNKSKQAADVTKGKDDLGDFEERTSKKSGEVDQFTDPFSRKDKKQAPDVDGEINEEQTEKESQFRVKVDENGQPVDKEAHEAVEDVKPKKGKKDSKKKKSGPKEIKGKKEKAGANVNVKINEETGDEEDESVQGTGFEKQAKKAVVSKKLNKEQKSTKKKILEVDSQVKSIAGKLDEVMRHFQKESSSQ